MSAPAATTGAGARLPVVDYLVLGEDPHLRAHECVSCAARFFDRRVACASCGAREFTEVRVPSQGTVRSFTIVHVAMPGVRTPFVSAIVDCEGTSVRATLVNVPPDPEHVRLGMAVRLVTSPIGTDEKGTEAVGFGFEPALRPESSRKP
ncbi:hypothetical protein GCM10009836_01520 [Pseudonocardia ailaonensis]|uniref:ChsH2 C-terminal OB-fold domain-containing protein n=1 Tax=Pseudonocardia ailaonensis TaxID=367279 RepID=A0ABN2MHH0_9PSEU